MAQPLPNTLSVPDAHQQATSSYQHTLSHYAAHAALTKSTNCAEMLLQKASLKPPLSLSATTTPHTTHTMLQRQPHKLCTQVPRNTSATECVDTFQLVQDAEDAGDKPMRCCCILLHGSSFCAGTHVLQTCCSPAAPNRSCRICCWCASRQLCRTTIPA